MENMNPTYFNAENYSNIESYQERMINEYNELVERIDKLKNFINGSDIYKHLDKEKQILMQVQLNGMETYQYALNKRIKLEIN